MRAIVTVTGGDQVGIIYNITKVLMDYNINVGDVSQTIMDGDIFVMHMLVTGENLQKELKALTADFATLEKKLGVSIRLQRQEVFDSMHRI